METKHDKNFFLHNAIACAHRHLMNILALPPLHIFYAHPKERPEDSTMFLDSTAVVDCVQSEQVAFATTIMVHHHNFVPEDSAPVEGRPQGPPRPSTG